MESKTINKDLSEASVEFLEIYKHSLEDIKNKIPLSFIKFLNYTSSKDYTFTYDESKKLNEQILKKETRGLIALAYKNYICDEEQRTEYNKLYNDFDAKRLEEYNKTINELYNKTVIEQEKNIDNNKTNQLVEIKKENLFVKIINKIKTYFSKKIKNKY